MTFVKPKITRYVCTITFIMEFFKNINVYTFIIGILNVIELCNHRMIMIYKILIRLHIPQENIKVERVYVILYLTHDMYFKIVITVEIS